MQTPIGVVITDTHLSEPTIAVNFSVWTQALELCRQHGVPLFHAGDIFTSRKGQIEIVLNAFKSILDMYEQANVPIYAIAGNHDKTNYTLQSSYLDAFNGGILQVLNPLGALHLGSLAVFMLPYYDEELSYLAKLEELKAFKTPSNPKKILITHVSVDGVRNNGGTKVDNHIKANLFDDFDLTLIGHYHNRQILGKKKNIIYCGSAYQANFGEDIHKGATIIYDDASCDFKQFSFPEYKTIEIDAGDIADCLTSAKEEIEPGMNIRIKIKGEVKETQKAMIVDLQKLVKVEVEKVAYSPVDVVQSDNLVIQDILSDYDAWSTDIEDKDYGRNILKRKI